MCMAGAGEMQNQNTGVRRKIEIRGEGGQRKIEIGGSQEPPPPTSIDGFPHPYQLNSHNLTIYYPYNN